MNSPITNPKPINQTCRLAKSLARRKNRFVGGGELSFASLSSKYKQGMITIRPAGYRVAAPRPENNPVVISSCQRSDFRSLKESQMTNAHKKLLRMWVLIKCAYITCIGRTA